MHAKELSFGHIGWKYYNSIKKKAMEQEFSWSGLLISLSIAFFIVLISAQILHIIHQSVEAGIIGAAADNSQKIYWLEKAVSGYNASKGNLV